MAREWMSLTLVDAYGRQTTLRREMQAQLVLADYQFEIADFVTKLAAVSDLGVVRADFVQTGVGDVVAVTAGANVDVGGTFSGWIEGVPGKKASTKIPGLKGSKVNPDGSVDLADADVAAFLALYSDDPGDFYISDGENVETWIKGSLDR